jgi:hypothetical protein
MRGVEKRKKGVLPLLTLKTNRFICVDRIAGQVESVRI